MYYELPLNEIFPKFRIIFQCFRPVKGTKDLCNFKHGSVSSSYTRKNRENKIAWFLHRYSLFIRYTRSSSFLRDTIILCQELKNCQIFRWKHSFYVFFQYCNYVILRCYPKKSSATKIFYRYHAENCAVKTCRAVDNERVTNFKE